MPLPSSKAETVSIPLVNGDHITIRAALADRVHGIDSDGDVLVTLGEPDHPIRHPDGSNYLIPLTPCCQADGKGGPTSTGVMCRACYAEVDSKYGGPSTVAIGRDLTGLLVRWEYEDQWLTARIAGTGTFLGSMRGKVVDPGNYVGFNSDLFGPSHVRVGTTLPNLLRAYLTIIGEQQPGDS